ncbi:Hypothetical predicted protein [Mytilus galloprovincialis]|uniref:Uncharacterized protein n=1 Tax=Mytilus galloprovincialis TaxID=29158 RepID=A0A8B6F410_MYTGA|nr:Hypothetical predicted protein [Mytilus galloprovincialis]
MYLPSLEHLDLSTLEVWTNIFHDSKSNCYCSLTSIHRGAIAKLTNLTYLDISNNRYLGLCGIRNISNDLIHTNIEIFRANNLYCEDSRSVTLYCDDIKYLRNTSLQELYIDGNNIALGQPAILTYMPKSLRVFSIRENLWGLGIYTYYPYDNMINLVHIDISNINNDEMSQSPMADHPCCSHFLGDVLCDKSRIENVTGDKAAGACSYTPNKYNNNIASKIQEEVSNKPDPWKCLPGSDIDVHYIMVPMNVESIVMNNSRLGYAFRWTIFNTRLIVKLTLSNNQFYSCIGPICNATNLKYLDLSGNRCSSLIFFQCPTIFGNSFTTQ